MKQPIDVKVSRVHGNSGDVVVSVTGADGDARNYHVPSEEGAYTAMTALKPRLLELLNEPIAAAEVKAAKKSAAKKPAKKGGRR